MNGFQVRTDLALEARESVGKVSGDIHGISVEEYQVKEAEIQVTKVMITSKNGAKALGKPMGTYITLEAPALMEPDELYHREVSIEMSKHIRNLIPNVHIEQSILVVGLGNRDVTADSLGPHVADNLFITRHVIKEYGKVAYKAYNKEKVHMISSIVPGVMAKNGMETAEIIKGIIDETKPDIVIVVDALASRSTKRLNRTVQITNTGIHPGSGVGNHRNELTIESLGVPVIAIGVPTVVDAATIVKDALDKMMHGISEKLANELDKVQPEVMSELMNFYVTGKDIDATIKRLSFTISEALNIAFEMQN